MRAYTGVNVGSAHQVVDGWLSLDHSKHVVVARIPGLARILHAMGVLPARRWPDHESGAWRKVRFWDARIRIPLPDGSVRYAYSSHTLEHFLPGQALKVVRDVLRVLEPGGVFRVVLPDLERVALAYVALQHSPACQFRDREITRVEWADAAAEFCFAATTGHESRFGHHWMYDRRSIGKLLLEAGFSSVRDCEFRKGAVPDLDQLDMAERRQDSLYVEAVR